MLFRRDSDPSSYFSMRPSQQLFPLLTQIDGVECTPLNPMTEHMFGMLTQTRPACPHCSKTAAVTEIPAKPGEGGTSCREKDRWSRVT